MPVTPVSSTCRGLIDALGAVPMPDLEVRGNKALDLFRQARGPALVIPVEYGGMGVDSAEAVLVTQAIGALSPSPAVATIMHHFSLATVFTLAGSVRTSGLEWALLEAMAGQNLLVASGFAEGRPGAGILSPTMTAVPAKGGGYLVNGSKKLCSLSHRMD